MPNAVDLEDCEYRILHLQDVEDISPGYKVDLLLQLSRSQDQRRIADALERIAHVLGPDGPLYQAVRLMATTIATLEARRR